jgi:hypothetical protein
LHDSNEYSMPAESRAHQVKQSRSNSLWAIYIWREGKGERLANLEEEKKFQRNQKKKKKKKTAVK